MPRVGFDRDISIPAALSRRKEVDCRLPHWKKRRSRYSRTVVSTPAFPRFLPSWSHRPEIGSATVFFFFFFFHSYAIQRRNERYVLAKTRPLVTNICMSRNRYTSTGRRSANSGERARIPGTQRVNSHLHLGKPNRHCWANIRFSDGVQDESLPRDLYLFYRNIYLIYGNVAISPWLIRLIAITSEKLDSNSDEWSTALNIDTWRDNVFLFFFAKMLRNVEP